MRKQHTNDKTYLHEECMIQFHKGENINFDTPSQYRLSRQLFKALQRGCVIARVFGFLVVS